MALGHKTGGRKAGTPNKRRNEIRDLLDKFARFDPATKEATKLDQDIKRLCELALSSDEQVALRALTLKLAYRFGKPPDTLEIESDGEGKRTSVVKFVLVESAAA